MKKKAEELKAKLEAIVVTEETNGVTVDCNANRQILTVHISESLMLDKTKLEETITIAMNKALKAAEKAAMGDVAEMAGLPGLGNLGNFFGK